MIDKRAILTAMLILTFVLISLGGCSSISEIKFELQGPVKKDWLDVDKSYSSAKILYADDRGDVFVSGGNNITFKYDSGGKKTSLAKANYPNVAAITSDNLGNIYLAGDYVVKLDPQGKVLWANRFKNESVPGSGASKIQLDNAGNIIAIGSFNRDARDNDVLVKYNSTGDTIWSSNFQGPYGHTVIIDKNGNIIFTGNGGLTSKYDPQGKELWEGIRGGWAVAADNAGNVYVTGDDGTTRYDENGKIAWSNSKKGAALAVDNSGNAYITHSVSDSPDYTIKYDSAGNTLWQRDYGGEYIAIDQADAVYIQNNSFSFDILKYNSEGETKWTANLIQSGTVIRNLTVDKLGNVFAAGEVSVEAFGDTPSSAYAVVKYSQQ